MTESMSVKYLTALSCCCSVGCGTFGLCAVHDFMIIVSTALSPQGSPHCDKETLHQRTDCVRPVACLCVGMERIHRCQGESDRSVSPFCSNT